MRNGQDTAIEALMEQLIANGKLLVVCCRFSQDRAPYAIPFPDHVIESIPLRTTRSNDQELHHE